MAFWGKKPGDEEKPMVKETVSSLNPVQAMTQAAAPQQAEQPIVQQDAKGDPYSKVRSALGPGTVIQGRLSFDSVVSIDGKLSGEIFSSKALLVGKSGTIEAQVEVASLIVRGVVKGTIKATERIEIREGGQLLGDVTTPILIMDEGCVFNGSVTMGQPVQAAPFKSTDTKTSNREKAVEPPAKKEEEKKKFEDAQASSVH